MSGKPNDPYLSEFNTSKVVTSKRFIFVGIFFREKFRGQGLRPNLTDVLSQNQNLNAKTGKIRYVNLCMMSLKLADSQEDISSE